ncbi:MAG: hypothetical protein E6H09_04920 [Bacteroidetes bacterium]|jgi:hypothetical protein|nr:MAG: hypothetical protein E6H09_04920 [Bacteroidota bacterium]
MKAIKYKLLYYSICGCILAMTFAGCRKLFGLENQKNVDHPTTTIDPHIYKNAWTYLKERALGSSPNDTIFKRFYQGIIYSGIDTNEYTKPGRTFIFYHNDAILRKSGTTTTTDCYFGKYKVGPAPGVAATKWEDYPPLQVKNHLLSLIVEGEHTFENITPDPEFDKTLMPLGYDPLNPESLIAFRVINDRDSRLRINDFPGSDYPTPNLATPGLQARTAGILSTNGPIHVVDRVVFFQKH